MKALWCRKKKEKSQNQHVNKSPAPVCCLQLLHSLSSKHSFYISTNLFATTGPKWPFLWNWPVKASVLWIVRQSTIRLFPPPCSLWKSNVAAFAKKKVFETMKTGLKYLKFEKVHTLGYLTRHIQLQVFQGLVGLNEGKEWAKKRRWNRDGGLMYWGVWRLSKEW